MFRLIVILVVVAFWTHVTIETRNDRAALKQYQACMARSDTTLDECLPAE